MNVLFYGLQVQLIHILMKDVGKLLQTVQLIFCGQAAEVIGEILDLEQHQLVFDIVPLRYEVFFKCFYRFG